MERAHATIVTSVSPVGTNELNRLFWFNGQFFRWCAKKVLFYLKTVKVVWIITDQNPNKADTSTYDDQQNRDHQTFLRKWANYEEACRNYILNCVSDELYYLYSNSFSSTKKIWSYLEKKYDSEEPRIKKYACSCYFNYKRVEEKLVLDQVHELQMIVRYIESEGINVDEQMQVPKIIDKLPESWKKF